MLHRAFADPSLPVTPPTDPTAAFDLARRFDLAGRIGARTPSRVLEAEVGSVATAITRTAHITVARSLGYEVTLKHVGGIAESLGIPLVLLKGSALVFLGISSSCARAFGDFDILTPVDRIRDLRTALVAAGWTHSPLPASEHQEAPLTHPSFGMIELHSCVPGVRPPGSRRSFAARALLEAGFTVALPGFAAFRVPSRSVLIAHALEHGLVQHGYSPGAYPLFRFLADLQDLGADAAQLREAGTFLRDVDSADLDAIDVLLTALRSGVALDLSQGPARSLLFHIVAGTVDSDYALGLKTDLRSLRSPSDLPPPLASLRFVYKAVVLSRASVDAIYGPPKSPGGYAARQLLRPFDLALRAVRSSTARRRAEP